MRYLAENRLDVTEREEKMKEQENNTAKVSENGTEVAKAAEAGSGQNATLSEIKVTAGQETTMSEERERITEESVSEALARENVLANPIRKGEVLISDECEGNLSAFKKALKDGFVIRPDGLEAVSFHCAGFAKRDEGLVAKQFCVTLKVNGKWQPLSRYIASGKGGRFAMGASQSLKGAKSLAEMLKAVWINGLDLKKKSKGKKA